MFLYKGRKVKKKRNLLPENFGSSFLLDILDIDRTWCPNR
jgi:hypothetical protein